MNNCVHNMLMLPWPKVGAQNSNPALVRALFGVYAGAHSELTAASQYFYNSLRLEEDADLANCLRASRKMKSCICAGWAS